MQQGLEGADVLVGAGGVHGEVALGHFGQEGVLVVDDGVDAPGEVAHLLGQHAQFILGLVSDVDVEVTLAHLEGSSLHFLDRAKDASHDGEGQREADDDGAHHDDDQDQRGVVEDLCAVGGGLCGAVAVVLRQRSQRVFQGSVGVHALLFQHLDGSLDVAGVCGREHFFVDLLVGAPVVFHGLEKIELFFVIRVDGVLIGRQDLVDLPAQRIHFRQPRLPGGFVGGGEVG